MLKYGIYQAGLKASHNKLVQVINTYNNLMTKVMRNGVNK